LRVYGFAMFQAFGGNTVWNKRWKLLKRVFFWARKWQHRYEVSFYSPNHIIVM
jgi:hypothetical protein